MRSLPLVALTIAAGSISSAALSSNVVAKRAQLWPTRTVDVLICDSEQIDQVGGRICARQKPKAGSAARSAELSSKQARMIRSTIRRWNGDYGDNIRLREVRKPTSTSTIVFRASSRPTRCSTQKVGFDQDQRFKYISIGRRCSERGSAPTNTGTVAHELLHAVGVYHEQQRVDRARMVRVAGTGAKAHQWRPTCDPTQRTCSRSDAQAMAVGRYDFGSVMHYSLKKPVARPTRHGKQRLKAQHLHTEDVGQREWLSEADERGLRLLYPDRRRRS